MRFGQEVQILTNVFFSKPSDFLKAVTGTPMCCKDWKHSMCGGSSSASNTYHKGNSQQSYVNKNKQTNGILIQKGTRTHSLSKLHYASVTAGGAWALSAGVVPRAAGSVGQSDASWGPAGTKRQMLLEAASLPPRTAPSDDVMRPVTRGGRPDYNKAPSRRDARCCHNGQVCVLCWGERKLV